jgi:hypothetical protein
MDKEKVLFGIVRNFKPLPATGPSEAQMGKSWM